MKKLVFMFVAIAAMSIASCGNKNVETAEVVDSTATDSVEVVDSIATDSVITVK